MHFRKQDLYGAHYKWAEDSDRHIFTGDPNRRTFDRFNGDQVLFLINYYGSMNDGFNTEEGKRIEHEIYNKLPLDSKSEISVINWIRDECFSEK